MKNSPINSTQMLNKYLANAEHSVGFLGDALRSAHTRACGDNPVLAILLLDLIWDAVRIEQRIKEIQGVL